MHRAQPRRALSRPALGLLVAVLCAGPAAAAGDDPPAPRTPSFARPKIGLALSGGGARGIAHVGVLKFLEEERIPIDYIAGTSMGALVGGLYASGLTPAQIEAAMLTIDWNDAFNDRPPRRDLWFRRKQDDASDLIQLEMGVKGGRVLLPRGLVAGQKIGYALASLTLQAASQRDFNQLPIPFRAVATDLGIGEMVVLKEGNLADCLRASMSIPGILAPFEMDGRLLSDGGLVRNLPVDVVRDMGADVVIAVDVSTPLLSPETLRSLPDITVQVTNMLTRQNVEEQIKNADLAIVPDMGPLTYNDYGAVAEIIKRGETSAREQAESLARYALSEEDYKARLALQHPPSQPPPHLDAITVEGITRVHPRIIERLIKSRAGAPLDLEVLKADLARIYALGDFERVDYALEQKDGKTKLIIRAREKAWGPDYLRFGVNLRNDFQGDTDFNVVSRLTMTRLNPVGAEWRTDVEFGETRRISTEFYQPLDFAGVFFVSPSIDYVNGITGVFEGNDRIAEYQTRVLTGSLAFGAQIGHYGEARVGLLRGWVKARPSVGAPDLPVIDVPAAAYAATLLIDRLDNPNFPDHGRSAYLDAFLARKSVGSEVSYDRVMGGIVQIFSRDRHHFFMGIDGGSNLGSDIPFYDEFPLGGLFSFSGFRVGQLRGQLFGVTRAGYYRRSGKLSGMFRRGIYLGGWLEAGNTWARSADVDLDHMHYAGTATIAADTFLGPLFIAFGHADGGNNTFYLSMGRSLGGRRRFGFGHN